MFLVGILEHLGAIRSETLRDLHDDGGRIAAQEAWSMPDWDDLIIKGT